MTEHYYSRQPEVRHDRQLHEEQLRGRTFRFVTDAGVFSKQGVDYGSRVLIEAMEIPTGGKLLDVGCGYGPIGLTAAWLSGHGEAVLLDMNERAVQLAEENARLNGIVNVRVLQSDLLEAVREERFDTVLTNPPIRAGKQVVHRLFEQAYKQLRESGRLWVVIQKKQGAPSAFAKLEELYDRVETVTKDKGYWIIQATKK